MGVRRGYSLDIIKHNIIGFITQLGGGCGGNGEGGRGNGEWGSGDVG